MRDEPTVPLIMIDCKYDRIRIHRNALHLLGNPNYIQLLVNPENLTIALLPSEKTRTAHAVRWDRLSDKHCCELYSKPLIVQLCNICPDWTRFGKYRIAGAYISERNLIQFSMNSGGDGSVPT